jgi:drug/metabolite transporter (DMT)-like permease
LSYVTVSTVSFYFLGERLSAEQIFGIVFIVLGVWCVAHSGWRSRDAVES